MQFLCPKTMVHLSNAFALTSVSNNEMIQKGERILTEMKNEPLYFSHICAYLSNQSHSPQNKLKAALELRNYTKDVYDENYFDLSSFSNLFCIYLQSDVKVSKILVQIFQSYCSDEFNQEKMEFFIEQLITRQKYVLKILKLFEKAYNASYAIIPVQKALHEKVFPILVAYFNQGERTNQPAEFYYRISKIMEIISQQNSQHQAIECTDLTEQLVQFAMALLASSDPKNTTDKYVIKMKISAINCLLFLTQNQYQESKVANLTLFSQDVWDKYIDQPAYTRHCLQYLKMLAQKKVYTAMFPNKDDLRTCIQKLLVKILEYTYNQAVFYEKLRSDSQEFIGCYFENQETSEIRREALFVLQAVTMNYTQILVETILETIAQPPVQNSIISFIVECWNQVSKTSSTVDYQQVPMQIYYSTIREHFGQLNQLVGDNKKRLGRDAVIRFVCEIRFVCRFSRHFDAKQLSIISELISKMAIKEQILSSVCYHVLSLLLFHFKKILRLDPTKFANEYNKILICMVQNRNNLTIEDLKLVEFGFKQISKNPNFIAAMADTLRNMLGILVMILDSNKEYTVVNLTFSLASSLLNIVECPPQLQALTLKFMQQKMFTPNLTKCFLFYLNKTGGGKDAAQSQIMEMLKTQYWIDNIHQGETNIKLFVCLIKLIPKDSEYYPLIFPQFLETMTNALKQKKAQLTNKDLQKITNIMNLLVEQFNEIAPEGGNSMALFRDLVSQYISLSKNKANPIIMKLIEFGFIVEDQGDMLQILESILIMKRVRIDSRNFRAYMIILFRFSRGFIGNKFVNGEDFTKTWAMYVDKMANYLIQTRRIEERGLFIELFTRFVEENAVNIAEIMDEPKQLKLSMVITGSDLSTQENNVVQ